MRRKLFPLLFAVLFVFCFPAYTYAESPTEFQARLANEFTTPPCTSGQNANLTINNGSSVFPITLNISSRTAGAITSLKINGLETVNDDDLGREIQYAFQIGGGGENNNPTEAGSANGTSSHFIEGCNTTTQLYTRSQMAYWIPYNGKSLSDYILTKKVEMGYGGNPNLIRFAARISIPETSSRLDIEIPTGYHSASFRQISLYNLQTHTIRASVPSDFVHNLWGVFTDAYTGDLTPILSDGTYSLFPYSPLSLGSIGVFYGYAAPGNTTKWSISHFYPNPQAGSSYYLESFLLVAKPNTIAPLIESLISSHPPLNTTSPSPTSTPTPTPIPFPNCKSISGQSTLIQGNTYTFSATYENYNGPMTDRGFVVAPTDCSSPWLSNQTSSGGPATLDWNFTPNQIGSFTVFCRAWNDSIAECRGDCVDHSPRYSCPGPVAKMTVIVVTPTPTSTPIPPTETPVPGCLCNVEGICTNVCTFERFTDISYINPFKCSLADSFFQSVPTADQKTGWCRDTLKTKGDANGDNLVNTLDYFYFVSAKSNGKIPPTVNPDFNGDGQVNDQDRVIIIKSLK